MCRYKSEGDPNGLSDCDSLRRENDMNHDLIRTLREQNRVFCDEVLRVRAELTRLREERRWIPVGERLPDGEEWVDVAGLWGDSVGWHEPSGWRNVDDDPCPGEVTHWRKRGPGPEVPNG
jgi:hypothetical protein